MTTTEHSTAENPQQQPRQGCEDVYLNWTSYKVTVSRQGYEQIVTLAQAMSVCHRCQRYYGENNMNVAGNLCLECFLQNDRHVLTFVGEAAPDLINRYHSTNAPYERPAYLFLDKKGYVYWTEAGPGEREEAYEDITATINYWEFPLPLEAKKNGDVVSLRGCSRSIYGNVRTDDIIMLRFWDYHPDIDVLFLAMRHGQSIQINKRRELHRRLFAEARQQLEATRTPGGKYLINGEYQERVYDSDVYCHVARLVEAEQKALRTAWQAEPDAQPATSAEPEESKEDDRNEDDPQE